MTWDGARQGAVAPDTAAAGRYDFLKARAREFLRDTGGAATEEALIRHVFGTGGSPRLWRPLLLQLFDDDAAFERGADGHWALAGALRTGDAGGDASHFPFVTIDLETTGLRPARQRAIEVAAVRYRNGQEAGVFTTLLRPDRPVPAGITALTGISNAMLERAPAFDEVVDDLLEFLGDDVLVGHNVEFDIAFLNRELRRAGRPPLLNRRLDTLPLAVGLLPALRRASLAHVAAALDIPPRERHRALPDAQLTGAVLGRLLPLARARGLDSLERLLAAAAEAAGRSADRRGTPSRARRPLDRGLLAPIPHAPGCYIMRDARDAVLYVGKAKDLRARVGSYYSSPTHYTRKLDGLLEAIATIETEVTGSEFDALLLEAQLIRRYQPRFNTVGRNFEHYPYIKLDLADAWPRVYATKRRADDGGLYRGPFRNSRAVQRAIDVLTELVPLRTCRQRAKSSDRRWAPCLRLTLGKCLGPCVGQTTPGDYAAPVADVTSFLNGDTRGVEARLWSQLEAASAGRDFERAAKLRDALGDIQAVAAEIAALGKAVRTDDLVLALPSPEPRHIEALLITRGQLWARFRLHRRDDPASVGTRLRAAWCRSVTVGPAPVDHESVDDINLVARWLHRHDGSLTTFALPATGDGEEWERLARQLLTCDPSRVEWPRDTESIAVVSGLDDAIPEPTVTPA